EPRDARAPRDRRHGRRPDVCRLRQGQQADARGFQPDRSAAQSDVFGRLRRRRSAAPNGAGRVAVSSRWALTLAAVLAAGCNEPPIPDGPNENWKPEGTWVEVWHDDFSGPAGSAPDATNWRVVTIASPPNQELEYYSDRRDNSFVDGNGHLVLRAIRED